MARRRTTKTKRVKRAMRPAGAKGKAKRPTRRVKTHHKAKKSTGLRLLKAPKPKAGPPNTSYLSWIEATESPEWGVAS